MKESWSLSPERYFDPNDDQSALARELYATVEDLPIVAPHGHVPPGLLSDPEATLGTPAELFIIPDHYVFRMLYSQGVALEDLGVPTQDGTPVETDHRNIWQRFRRELPPLPRHPDWPMADRGAHKRLRCRGEAGRRERPGGLRLSGG